MTDLVQELLSAGVVPTNNLPATSRYRDVGTAEYAPPTEPGDEPRTIAYYRRRLCPPPEQFTTLSVYTTVEADRRDLIAAREVGNPELWWQVADANAILDPATMVEPSGRQLRITLPASVQGAPDA